MNRIIKKLSILALAPIMTANVFAAVAPQNLPLVKISDLQYVGGFAFPSAQYGSATATYAQGVIGLGAGGNSMFVVGEAQKQPLAEFAIPALVNSLNVSDFNVASVSQGFTSILNRPASGNPQGLDTISGMHYLNGELIVNANVFYDAGGTSTNTTLVIKDASKISTSAIAGYHSLDARAHGSGWISPVPAEWQSLVGGPFITGYPPGLAIISRLSVGPSAFVFNPTNPDIGQLSPSKIPTTALLDYDMNHALGMAESSMSNNFDNYIYNKDLSNDLWTVVSSAAYGFIVPGTRSYLVLGYNGGMVSGLGYKITQDTGNVCGGPCPYKASDYDNYYWLFDMNDLVKVKSGAMAPYQVRPYAYGRLSIPYPHSGFKAIVGGDYDAAKGLLYLSLEEKSVDGFGSAPPYVAAFKINTSGAMVLSPPSSPSNITIQVQ